MINVTIDAILFYTLLKMVSKVVDEVTVRFNEDGMRIRQLDISEVSMVDAFIPRNWFSNYDVTTQTDNLGNTVGNTIAFRISDVKLLKKRPKKDARLALGHGIESGQGTVKLGLSGLTMVVPCFPDDGKDLPVPKVELKQKAKTNPKLLLDFAKEAVHVNDAIRLTANDTELILTAKGEISEMTRALSDEEDDIIDYSLTKGVYANYDLGRLLKFVETPFDGWVQVEFDKDLPLRLTYELSSGDITTWDRKAQVIFFLAPKVDRSEPTPQEPMNECGGCGSKVLTVNVVDVDGKTMELCDNCWEQAKQGKRPWIKEPEAVQELPAANPTEIPLEPVVEEPKVEAYVCENCGRDIEEGRGKRLEDGDTWLCEACAICETCEKKAEEQEKPVVAEISQVPAPQDLICSSCGSHLGEKYFKSEDGKLLCEYCGKPVEVAVVDPLDAFRNRWSKR